MPSIGFVRPQILARLGLALVPFLFPLPAPAPTAPAPAGAAAANPIEVTVDLMARDKKGNVVPDLKPSDVEIIDGGVAVSLKSLRLATQPQSITFVFDQVVPGVGKTQRELAEEFLAGVSGHGYLFAVLKVEGRLHLVQAPTTDIEAVKSAIAAATVAKRPDYIKVTEAAEKQITEDMEAAGGARQATAKMLMAMLMDSQKTAQGDAQSTPSVAALLAASRGQQDVPGRKSILYFSQGLVWHSSSPETLRDVAQAANKARVSIYSFDAELGDVQAANALIAGNAVGTSQAMGGIASGSLTQGMGASPTAEGPGAGAQANEYAGRMQSGDNAANSPKSLAGICQSTGGMHVVVSGGEGRKGASEIAAELNAYYLASWISPAPGDDTRLRPISVKSLRKGVLIASRAAYYPTRGNVERVSSVEGRLIEALAATELPADLPMNAALLRYGNTPDNDLNSVLVQVPVDYTEAKSDQGSVSVLVQLKDASGAVVQKFSGDVARRRPVGDQEQTPQDVVSFRRQFSAPAGEYMLESAAFDANGGKIGAQRTSVVIPAMADGLALGDVLLVRRIEPAGASKAPDPLRCAKGVVVPNLSGHVSKSEGAKIDLFFDLHTDPGSTEAPSLSAELRRDGNLIGSLPLKLTADPTRKTIPYLTTLSATSLPAGQYEMTIILSQGGQKVTQSVSFALD